MSYQIEQWPAIKVAGIRRRIKTDQAFGQIPQMWDTAWKDGTMNLLTDLFRKTDYRPAGFIGMSGEFRRDGLYHRCDKPCGG